MTTTLNEDTLYIRSSQYRLWSSPPSTVKSYRTTANKSTSERLLKRRKLHHDSQAASPSSAPLNLNAAEPLTPDEELSVLTQYYISLIPQILGTFFPQIAAFENVRNSAAQYLRRFYLNRSVMDPLGLTILTTPSNASQSASAPAFTFNPTSNTSPPFTLDTPTTLLLASLYLSTKIHDAFLPLDQFVQRLHEKGARKEEPANRFEGIEGLTVELVKKAEQILTRGLRFAFEVRHPGDGIAGLEMEICSILREAASLASVNGVGHDERARRGKLRSELLALGAPDEDEAEETRITKSTSRLKTALQKTKNILHSAAHASDVYFHFTPSQILLAGLLLADEALADVYLRWKLQLDSPDAYREGNGNDAAAEVAQKILATIRRCSSLLAAAAEREESTQLAALLVRLRAVHALLSVPAPVPVNAPGAGGEAGMLDDSDAAPSVKRGFDSSDEEEEDVVSGMGKKKKRRRIEDDDVFGGPLKASA